MLHCTNVLTTCAFSGDGQFLLAGTYMGDVKMFNLQTSEETTYQVWHAGSQARRQSGLGASLGFMGNHNEIVQIFY